MKKILLSLLATAAFGYAFGQKDVLASIGSGENTINFEDFRFVDWKKGTDQLIAAKNTEIPDQVVGMTYDKKNQKMIFTGMYAPDVYTYDLATQQFQRIYASGKAHSRCALAEQFSRMGTASNGVSYALNNGGTMLIEIQPMNGGFAVKELGALNADVNINQYKFYGGDLIADKTGHLYLISAQAQVVKINPKTMQATFAGSVKGLEEGFTTNGSAVLADGKVLLSNSAGKGFYTLDFNSLKAAKFSANYSKPIYDLASSYLLQGVESNAVSNTFVSVYPTKITDRNITVAVNSKMEGMGVVNIYDIAGNQLITSKMNLADIQNSKTVNLNNLSPGNYIIKVTDFQGKELINEKFILLR